MTGVNGISCLVYFHRCARQLHRSMMAATVRQTMTWFDTTPVGRILNRFGQDVMQLDFMFPMFFAMTSTMFGKTVITIILAGITAVPALLFALILLTAVRAVFQ